jgi:hypothetical protein
MIGFEERIKIDSVFVQNIQALEAFTQRYIKILKGKGAQGLRSGIITIPVVVHVVYKTGAQNISDTQIQSQIDVLNEDFRELNTDISNVPAEFSGLTSDIRIEFQLAARDPDCNNTTGITRTSTTADDFDYDPYGSTPTARNPVKFSSSGGVDGWPPDEYLNIWVCNLSSGLLGYASFPADLSTRPDEDGVVIDYQSFGNTGNVVSPFDLGRTATHEIGHWLNLRHIWGDGGSGCVATDYVDDTPNQEYYNFGCPAHPQTSCGSHDMFMNYMDYVDDDCMIMFTDGQSDRMDACLYSTRADILSSEGLISPPSGVTDDLWSKDTDDDIGDEPNTLSSYVCLSDDIWVRRTSDGLTNQEHENPLGGATNYVYVRVRNRGCQNASNAKVKLYWAKASSGLGWPAPWDGSVTTPALMGDLIGTGNTGNVAGSGFTILEYSWTVPNPADYAGIGGSKTHFCLLSRIETSNTSPYGMTFPETGSLSGNVRNNNNIVWKNITIAEDDGSGGRFLSFFVANFNRYVTKTKLVFEQVKKEKSPFDIGTLTVEPDRDLYRIWADGGKKGNHIKDVGDNIIEILQSGATLENIELKPNEIKVLNVKLRPGPEAPNNRQIYKLNVLQYQTDGTDIFMGGQNLVFKVEYDKSKEEIVDGIDWWKYLWWLIIIIIIIRRKK